MASSSPERQFRAELFRTIVNYDDETTQLREKLELAEKELEAIKRSNSVGKSSSSPQDSVIELETRLNESIEAQTRLEVILSTLQTELDEKTRQCLEYQDMLGKMSASGADEDSMTRTVRIQELQEQLDEAQGQLEEYKLAQRPETQSALRLAEMQSKVEAMNGQISHAKKYTAQLKAENASLAQSLVQLEGTVRNKNQEITRLQAELHASKGREEQLKVRYCIVKSQISNLRSQNNMSDRQAPHNRVGRCDMATQTSAALPVSVKPSPPTQAQPQPRDTSLGLLTIRIPRTQPSSTQLPSTTTIHDAPHQTRAQTSHGRAHIVSPAAMPPQATAPVPQPRNPVSAQPPSGTSTLPVSTYDRFPKARSRILGRLPVVSVPQCATGDILFSTTRLNYILGGGYRMDAEFTALSPIRIAHGITGRLYLHRHLNPWLPARPGEHGYLFFGLKGSWGRDDVKYVEPVNRAIFVEENKGLWRYYGQYLVQRCTDDDLSQAEWKTLRAELENVQESFADLTLRKSLRKEDYQSMIQHRPDEYHEKRRDICEEYDDGTRRVPCVILRCVEYNEALFQAIHSTNILPINAPIVKRKRKTGSHPGGPVSRRKL